MVVIIRRDLDMSKSYLATQVATAILNSFMSGQTASVSQSVDLEFADIEWLKGGGRKEIFVCDTEEELFLRHAMAKDAKMHTSLALESGISNSRLRPTYTCLAIGPALSAEIEIVTKGLQLL
jgi:PTH2 family peptidyl-tRNA hydrolase